MQLSVKTPAELTVPTLEACAIVDYRNPSAFVSDCVFQCIQGMDSPHSNFTPLRMVEKYYEALGQEAKLQGKGNFFQVSAQKKRMTEARKRVSAMRSGFPKGFPKHLPIKISPAGVDLTERIKAKVAWLQISPNAFVMRCLRDCIEAMDDPKKALLPPPVVVDFWTASHARLRPKPKDGLEAMVLASQETILRQKSIPILDTIVRLAQREQWDADLKTILRDAGVLSKDR